MKIKFAHLSDCHLGAWRNENLNEIGYDAFKQAINKIIEENVDFVIISGDLYDVSNPKVDVVDLTTQQLKKLNDHNILVYGIMGSHDFSPSDKSMIRPLISAGLFINVSKGEMTEDGKLQLFFTSDKKTNIKITGLRAMKRSLEIEDFRVLERESLENINGVKIFVFHTILSELKPEDHKELESAPKSLLPQNFDYYAGGHIHKTIPGKLREKQEPFSCNTIGNIIYPGSLYPTNFRELENYGFGGFCVVSGEIENDSLISDLCVEYIPIRIREVKSIKIDCENKSIADVLEQIDKSLEKVEFNEKIVTLRLFGSLSSGKTYDIKTNEVILSIKEKGAFEVFLNKVALTSSEYAPISVVVGKSDREIEETLIHEHAQQMEIKNISKSDLENKIHQLLESIGEERQEGTAVKEYETTVVDNFAKIFKL